MLMEDHEVANWAGSYRSLRIGAYVRAARGRWWVVGLVMVLLWASACSDSDGKGHQDTGTATQGPVPVGTSFDPPSRFDLTRTVSLNKDDVLHGTLHDTMFLSVTNDALRAVDLRSGAQSWSVDLSTGSEQYYLGSPFVTNNIVAAVTAENSRSDVYTISVTGVDVDTGDVAWKSSIPPLRIPLIPGYVPSDEFCRVHFTEHSDGLLITLDGQFDPLTTFFLDPSTGNIHWIADVLVFGIATGPYALAFFIVPDGDRYYRHVVVFDLRTGQIGTQLTDSAGGIRLYVDAHNDESYIVVNLDSGRPDSFLRFSSADSSVQPFAPSEGDMRYEKDADCSLEAGQPVLLCQIAHTGVYGVDPVSGRTVWASDDATHYYVFQYHGNVYGVMSYIDSDPFEAFSLVSGQPVNSDLQIQPIIVDAARSRPIMVNEYGAVGVFNGEYVWAPASG